LALGYRLLVGQHLDSGNAFFPGFLSASEGCGENEDHFGTLKEKDVLEAASRISE